MEDCPGELAYIVLWSRNEVSGTHRAVLRRDPREGEENEMLVWGHYFPGTRLAGLAEARRDFNRRSNNDHDL